MTMNSKITLEKLLEQNNSFTLCLWIVNIVSLTASKSKFMLLCGVLTQNSIIDLSKLLVLERNIEFYLLALGLKKHFRNNI
jgi:hypothetical protein